jgi:predicted RecB family endonuclease
MVLLASRELWPNVHSVAHWRGELERVLIYATENEEFSLLPARHLKSLIASTCPGVHVELLERLGIQPQHVRAQLEAWRAAYPGRRWILNATGGTKLMSAGMLAFVGRPDTRVVYRELGGNDWFEFHSADQGLATREIAVPVEATDFLPAVELVKALWQVPPGVKVESEAPQALPLPELTRAAMECKWDWQAAFRRAGARADAAGGILFERYVAAGLLAMGVKSVACNVRALGTSEYQEVDLVANHGGRLVVVDCKLRSPKDEERANVGKVMDQIRHAGDTRRRLGGLGAKMVLIRPNRTFDEIAQDLARNLEVKLVDQRGAPQLFSKLAEILDVDPLPAPVKAVEDMLVEEVRSGRASRVFVSEPGIIAQTSVPEEGFGVARLDAYMKERGQSWVAFFVDNDFELSCAVPRGGDPLKFQQSLRTFLGPFAKSASGISIVATAGRCRVRAPLKSGNLAELSRILEKWLGKDFTPP